MKKELNHRSGESLEDIVDMVRRYRASGMSLERFAQEHSIPPGRLHYWIYQKNRAAISKGSSKDARRTSALRFQEVKLSGSMPLVQSWAAEVCLGQGVTVRFSASTTPAWIGSVVQALQPPC